ncbi:5' exonuclease Apollo [Brachyhypopomus gauderio]|uniref:5' exonuclease Apollo n=1 Tax=Brachyhypopomus gauderio TaxID=698409 RepID=UPI0040431ABC
MNGKIIANTPIAVDCWQLRKCSHVRLFFLSHMHTDHTSGLTSTWSNRPIYCSPVTATLLRRKLQVKENWIHALEVGEPHMLPLDDIGKERMTVTLIDANHCPGAVMFFFEGYFGTILYTGDFRYTPSMLREPCLRNNTTIDVLYLDNTNCDPTRSIPSRRQACQQMKEIIRAHPNYTVVIGVYALGKESLLVELAMEFKTWVEVDLERLETLQALELPDVFTTEQGAGRFRAVRQSEINASNLLAWNKEWPTIAILPTSRPVVSCHPNVYVVPYSDHSSYLELEDFVSALRPVALLPIVGNCLPYFSSLLSPLRKPRPVVVPESVQHYMAGEPSGPRGAFNPATVPRQPLRSLPRGVVFESPGQKRLNNGVNNGDLDSSDGVNEVSSDADADSDCVLLDMSADLTHSPCSPLHRGTTLARVTSEDTMTINSLSIQLDAHDDESFVAQNGFMSLNTKSLSDFGVSQNPKKGPQLGSAHPRATCPSMDSINLHDGTCMLAMEALTPAETLQEPLAQSARVTTEQWLLGNFTIPEEELVGQRSVFRGSRLAYSLIPFSVLEPKSDPFEAAIQRLKSKPVFM